MIRKLLTTAFITLTLSHAPQLLAQGCCDCECECCEHCGDDCECDHCDHG